MFKKICVVQFLRYRKRKKLYILHITFYGIHKYKNWLFLRLVDWFSGISEQINVLHKSLLDEHFFLQIRVRHRTSSRFMFLLFSFRFTAALVCLSVFRCPNICHFLLRYRLHNKTTLSDRKKHVLKLRHETPKPASCPSLYLGHFSNTFYMVIERKKTNSDRQIAWTDDVLRINRQCPRVRKTYET